MTINDFRVQLATAYPDPQRIETSKGRTLRGDIQSEAGPVKAYIKLLNVGDIAKEALCSVLARVLQLPVPQPFYVAIDPTVAGQALSNLHGIAFGLQDELLPFQRILNYDGTMLSELMQWPELYRCAAFDAWIANRDRLPNNLLFAGNHDFWMIDHDEALPSYLTSSSPVYTSLFEIIKKGKSEHELYRIRELMMSYADQYRQVNWDEIISLVRINELPDSEKYFGGFISNLRERAVHMRNIISAELGIKQISIEFIGDRMKNSEVVNKP